MATATNLSINCIFTFRDTEEMEKSIILNRFSVVFYFIIIIIILHSPFFSVQFLILPIVDILFVQ